MQLASIEAFDMYVPVMMPHVGLAVGPVHVGSNVLTGDVCLWL